jgi:hypothetical protein
MDLLGYELDDEQEAELDALIAGKQANADRMAQLAASRPLNPVPPQFQDPGEPKQPPANNLQQDQQQKTFRLDLERWQRKVENRLKAGKAAQVEFASSAIPADVNGRIYGELATATDADAVKAIFREARPSDAGVPFRY